ncbi:cytochrome b-c1 complex subunit 7-like [Ctenocephalides felis]|uniref:cytochrome b-c1 complex subunit 7-like n=1 Tax=Ctenocephalides felis TaxID=7515 RepID=UPI000E6E1FD9|nr:cytochrome b-c1 complex subunit 7-like [Ctenocephalides felis]
MASTAPKTFRTVNSVKDKIKKWAYNASGFNQYGLHLDDVRHEDADVTEALRRLPQNIVDERNFRLVRAMQLSMNKITLPKDQWIKWEEDWRYLTPVLEQVKKEKLEKDEWNKK